MGIIKGILVIILSFAMLALVIAMLVYCVKMLLLFFSQPIIKGLSIGILLFAAFICFKDLKDNFNWENLGYGVLFIVICVGLLFLKSSGNYEIYQKERRWERRFEDKSKYEDYKVSGKKQTNPSYSSYDDSMLRRQEEEIRRRQEEADRHFEEQQRRQQEYEERMKEAERHRGRPVAGGACKYLYSREAGYYEGWKVYRCDVTGAEFEEEYCRKHCLYADYFYKCPYSGYN